MEKKKARRRRQPPLAARRRLPDMPVAATRKECNQKHLSLFQHQNLLEHAAKQSASLAKELDMPLEYCFERHRQNIGPTGVPQSWRIFGDRNSRAAWRHAL